MSQTREDRIWRHYKALRKTAAIEGFDPNWKWLTLARKWQMPVREVKDIIAARKGPTMVPVWCCEDRCFVESWREITPAEQAARPRRLRLRAEVAKARKSVTGHDCDVCEAPTDGPDDGYHRDGCPDLAGVYRPDEAWYDHDVRRLGAELAAWRTLAATRPAGATR